jgi:hypothetical protein
MRPLVTIGVVALACRGAVAAAEPATIIVGTGGDETTDVLISRTRALGGTVRTCSASARLCILDGLDSAGRDDVARVSGVTWIEEDRPIGIAARLEAPAGPGASPLVPGRFDDLSGTAGCTEQQELVLVRADEVWDRGIDGTNAPVVAVIDLGFYADHLDLQGRIAGQYDYGDLDDVAEVQPMVPVPHHGTFIAGLIAAAPTNGVGRAGIAPYGQLFLQRVVDSANNQDLSFTIHALTDVADNHPEVRVVSYSLLPSVISDAYEQAVEALGDRGVLFVVSAGNCGVERCVEADNDDYPLYPQSYPYEHILVVASSDLDDQLNEWSHYGRASVDLFSPSVDLCSLDVTSDTATRIGSGTSFAAPQVAGAAALVMEAHPSMRTIDVSRVLTASVHPVSAFADLVSSGGRLDVAAAVAAAVPFVAWPPDVVVDGTTDLVLDPVSNDGARGDATVIVLHDPGVEVSIGTPAGVWQGERIESGATIDLPDAGTLTAPSPGLLVRGEIDEHVTTSIPLVLRGTALGFSAATVRMVLVSAEGTVLGAPYRNDGSVTDATGREAHPFSIEVVGVAPDDERDDVLDGGVEPDAAPDAGPDAGPDAEPDAGPDADRDASPDPDDGNDGGCSVASGLPAGAPSTGLAWVVAMVLAEAATRRFRARGR